VDAIAQKFKEGDFDGMTDCYNYAPDAFNDAFGGCRYVFTSRTINRETFEQVAAALRTECPDHPEHQHGTLAHRATCKASMYNKGAFKGLEIVSGQLRAVFEELPAPVTVPATDAARQEPIQAGAVRIEEHTHTKHGFQFWLVILSDRLERAEFDALVSTCKAGGGWYSRQWGSTPGGFAFKDKSAAEAFAAAIGGTETPPTGTDAPPAPAPVNPEADEISPEDLEAAAEMFDTLRS